MAVRFRTLVPYRSTVDRRVWWRYQALTDDELKSHLEYTSAEHSDVEDDVHARDMVAHVKELYLDEESGVIKVTDPDDIADTMIEGSGSVLALEAVRAMLRRAFVSDEDAPFRRSSAPLDADPGG